MSNHFRDLLVWQKSVAFVTEIYCVTEHFPKTETYGLTAQIRRASVSIPSNIAEGQGRRSPNEFHLFLGHARGSLSEVQTQLIIAGNLGYFDPQKRETMLESSYEISRMLNGLMLSIEKLKK